MGGKYTVSRSSRMSSTPRFDAASISMTSTKDPSAIALQFGQTPQGFSPLSAVQFSAFASSLAVVVLPVPRVPQNRYACPVVPVAS